MNTAKEPEIRNYLKSLRIKMNRKKLQMQLIS